ncbi:hypothetical protein QIO46_gp3 [ssRNA phage Zoerhiza.4_22]|uniref:Uncharacterized protein n=2 Tax=Leviviricetes TaxID=2842243 RepID=A0A8S5L206_9VIRU|nr:hypothetical protein QIO46_gp3 [ssRNA phage Zoerhiza.4_22]QDH86761.1 MAG: hypothetical protein H4Rhizo45395_000002 [Leviviridae sp.]DAD51878.1 TPA_asm: hypothetical protein [ssRNA phage Zoerhiza.4_22]
MLDFISAFVSVYTEPYTIHIVFSVKRLAELLQ